MKHAALIGLCLSVTLAAIPATATTYLVRPDGTGDFPTIQEALDAARDGDIVELADGVFTGQGNRTLHYNGRSIVVRSQSGDPDACIINPEGYIGAYTRAFRFDEGEDAEAVVQGITMTGGYYNYGGAIRFTEESSPTIVNCKIIGCTARYRGGAIHCSGGSSPIFRDCEFIDNTAELDGGAVFCDGSGHPFFIRCRFESNTVTGGLACIGGGMHLTGDGPVSVTDCVFIGNDAWSGGGIACAGASTARIAHCLFDSNTSEESGGAVLCKQSSPVLGKCVFVGNHAGTYGGAIRVRIGAEVRIANCAFLENVADWGGGALYTGGSTVRIESSTMAYNDAPSGGGIFNSDAAVILESVLIAFSARGHSFRWTCAGPDPVISCCNFHGNPSGDWFGCGIADQCDINGNFSADPLFCGPINGSTPTISAASSQLSLHSDSPCLPGNHPVGEECGGVGAFGQGCGASKSRWAVVGPRPLAETAMTESSTWGKIKAGYK